MEIKLRELLNAKESLAKILNADLPIKISYRLSKTVKAVNLEMQNFEEKRNDLIKKYGEQEGNLYKVKPESEKFILFSEEMEDLLELSVKIDIEPIDLSEIEGIKLSAVDLANVEKFIEVKQ